MRLRTPCLVAFLTLFVSGQSVPTDTHVDTTGPLALAHESALVASNDHSLEPRFLGFHFMFADLVVAAIAVPTFYLGFTVVLRRVFELIVDDLAKKSLRPGTSLVVGLGRVRWEFGCLTHPLKEEFMEGYFRKRLQDAERGWLPINGREWWGTAAKGSRECYVSVRVVGVNLGGRMRIG